jgi:ABC-type Zn2+ transport system substrate-binding protein/surface adhesin
MASAPHDHHHDHHDHDHGHGHGHGHGHNHAHGPVGALELAPRAAAAMAGPSLLRLSAALRLALAGGLVALIWLGVLWAVR